MTSKFGITVDEFKNQRAQMDAIRPLVEKFFKLIKDASNIYWNTKEGWFFKRAWRIPDPWSWRPLAMLNELLEKNHLPRDRLDFVETAKDLDFSVGARATVEGLCQVLLDTRDAANFHTNQRILEQVTAELLEENIEYWKNFDPVKGEFRE